jgi:hypothetical protein
MCACVNLTEQTIRQFNLVEFVAKCAKQTVVKHKLTIQKNKIIQLGFFFFEWFFGIVGE